MKFGVISLGNHARNRVMPAMVRAGHEIVALYSRNIDKAGREALKYSSKAFSKMDDFLDSDIDAVYISSPNFLHYEHAKNCLLHGKHVLLEKQMTLGDEDARELVDLSVSRKLALGVGFHLRFHPAINDVRDMVQNGSLGQVVFVSGMWAYHSARTYDDADTRWWKEAEKAGGGSIMGTGVHVIDTINYVMGQTPLAIVGTKIPRGETIETTEHVTMHFKDAIADAISSRAVGAADNSLSVYGTKGFVICRDAFSTTVNATVISNGDVPREYRDGNLYEAEVKGFVDLANGGTSSIASGKEGYNVVRIVNAASASDSSGRMVQL